MTIELITHNGHINVSEFVTDGIDTWLMTEQFVGYTEEEALALFESVLRDKNLTKVY